jgi:hypothetical protein
MALHVFFTRERKHLEGGRLPQIFCCEQRLKRADCPVCLIGWENRTNDGIDVRMEKGPGHSTSEALTHDVANYGVRSDAILS